MKDKLLDLIRWFRYRDLTGKRVFIPANPEHEIHAETFRILGRNPHRVDEWVVKSASGHSTIYCSGQYLRRHKIIN